MGYKWFCLALVATLPLSAQVFKMNKEQLTEITRKNPYERFADGRPKVPNEILEKVRGLSVEEVWGPLRSDPGYANQYEGSWQIMHPGKKLVGRVEAFGEPAVDVAEQLPRVGVFALALPELGEAGRGAQFE